MKYRQIQYMTPAVNVEIYSSVWLLVIALEFYGAFPPDGVGRLLSRTRPAVVLHWGTETPERVPATAGKFELLGHPTLLPHCARSSFSLDRTAGYTVSGCYEITMLTAAAAISVLKPRPTIRVLSA